MRRFAGSCRFVFDKALALQKERYEQGEKKLGDAGLCKLLTEWRNGPETPWLADAPVHPVYRMPSWLLLVVAVPGAVRCASAPGRGFAVLVTLGLVMLGLRVDSSHAASMRERSVGSAVRALFTLRSTMCVRIVVAIREEDASSSSSSCRRLLLEAVTSPSTVSG